MKHVAFAVRDQRVAARRIDVRRYLAVTPREVEAGVELAEQATGEYGDGEKTRARFAHQEMESPFEIGTAATELIVRGDFQQCVRHWRARSVEDLSLQPDPIRRAHRVSLERQREPEERRSEERRVGKGRR